MTPALGLETVLGGRAVVLNRRSNAYTSTSPTEIVTCQLDDGREIQLLCKRPGRVEHRAFGHRGDLAYEASVYREVLAASGFSAPHFYGETTGDDHTLVIEFMDRATCADEAVPIADAMCVAARWAGRFHARYDGASPPLTRYDAAYYRLWPRRTLELAGTWLERLPWLTGFCRRAEAYMGEIAEQPATVIHGEFTPHNVLIRDGVAYPVDWESSAIALGEIDLACLVDKWPADVASRCEAEYVFARWPEGRPAAFARRLDMARLYWDLRWLGDRPEWTASEKVRPRFEHLRVVGERLGLL